MPGFNFTSYNSFFIIIVGPGYWNSSPDHYVFFFSFPESNYEGCAACGLNSGRGQLFPDRNSFYLLFEGN